VLDTLIAAREAGQLLHDMPAEVTHALAEDYEVYTTTTPRHPGTPREHLRRARYAHALGKIGTNLTTMLGRVPEYAESARNGTLSVALTEDFGAITHSVTPRVRVSNPRKLWGKVVDGTVVADSTTYYVREPREATRLGIALSALLHSSEPEDFRAVVPVGANRVSPDLGSPDRTPSVRVDHPTEHDPRSIDRARLALWTGWLAARDITLPRQKRTLAQWEKDNETFPPWLREQLLQAKAAYERMSAKASYVDPTDPTKVSDLIEVPLSRLIGTDIPEIKRDRDAFNRLIRQLRGGKHRNPEQNPNRTARPTMERRVNLKRGRVSPEEAQDGAPMPNVLSLFETGLLYTTETLQRLKSHPARTLWEGAAWLAKKFFGGLADIAISPIDHGPAAIKATGRFFGYLRDWRIQRHRAIAAGSRLDDIIAQLVEIRGVRDTENQQNLSALGLRLRPSRYTE